MEKEGKKGTHVVVANQITDENCSIGKSVKRSQISELARRVNSGSSRLTLVLTAEDVVVEGF